MGKQSNLIIQESIKTLKKTLSKQTKPKNVDRVRSLILIKEGRLSTRKEISDVLGYNIRTMEVWLAKYKKGGMENMLIPVTLKRKSRIFTKEMHNSLESIVTDSDKGFRSYKEAEQWINEEFKVSIGYHSVRWYLIRHFGTKLKSPRKSHVNKDKDAAASFLKTTKGLDTY